MEKKLYPKEIGITDINQDTGVTPEQIIKYLHKVSYLSQQIFKMITQLNEVEINDAINDATINVYTKMKEGKVPNKDFQEFKSYLFIAFKNSIQRQLGSRRILKNQIISKALDYHEVIPDDYLVINPFAGEDNNLEYFKRLLKQGFDMMAPHQQEIVRDILRGKPLIEVSSNLGKNKSYANSIMIMLRKIVRRLHKDPNYEFRGLYTK